MTSALCAAGLLGLMFESTRWIGIACVTVLMLLYPLSFLLLLLVGGGVAIFLNYY